MKMIWITPECPYPANTGGRVGMWKRISHLAYRNEIYLYTIVDAESEKQYAYEIKKYCTEVKFYSRRSIFSSLLACIRLPYPAVSRWNSQLTEDLRIDFRKINPDWIIIDFPQMIGALPENILRSQRLVLNQHNIEFLSLRSLGNGLGGWKRKIYELISKQMEHYESSIYQKIKISLFTFVSSSDKRYFENRFGKHNTFLVPVGSEICECKIKANCHNLIFVAKMSYPANEEGAIWLVNYIMPQILEKVPDAHLYLVGKEPRETLINVCKDKKYVELTGTVDDLKPYYEKCNLAVVPIMTGGGVNVKLLEALGQDKLVVTTSKGIEGTDFKNNIHLKVADNPNDFACDCIDILLNPTSNENMQRRQRARDIMINKYSWDGICNSFENKLKQLTNAYVN